MTPAYIDANVFLYMMGGEHRYREPCRRIVRLLGKRRLHGEISALVLQEIVHHRRRRGDADATSRARDVAAACAAVHDFTMDDLHRALGLVERHPELTTFDGVHAGIAVGRDLRVLISADRHFDAVSGLRRVDPLDEAAVDELTS